MDGYINDKDVEDEKSTKEGSKKKKKEKSADAKKSKKKRVKKDKEKDPDEPKKPLTAFMLFCNYRRGLMKDTGKSKGKLLKNWIEMTENEKLKIIGEEWGQMSDVDKEVGTNL